MTPRHLCLSSERVIFLLGYYWIDGTASPCEQKEEESKILDLVSSVEMKITERVTSWKNIYLIYELMAISSLSDGDVNSALNVLIPRSCNFKFL